jgi:predicted ATP-dependent serine protease
VKQQPLLEQVAETLNIPPGAELVGGIVFEPFDELLRTGVPEPDVLVDDALYTVGLHLVSGHPGDGKTSWVMQLAWIAMAEGRDVVWLDYEGGLKPTLRRLLAIGVPAATLRSKFHYAGFPDHAETHLTAVSQRWPGALVVVDSLSKALSYAGIDEDSNTEVTKFVVPIVKACLKNDLPIVIIDHVPKNAKGSRYSRGAGAKLADVMVHWGVEKTQDFNRTQAVSITVHQHKDREGCLPFATWWSMGDGNGRLTIAPMDAPPDPKDPNAPSL